MFPNTPAIAILTPLSVLVTETLTLDHGFPKARLVLEDIRSMSRIQWIVERVWVRGMGQEGGAMSVLQ